MKVFINERILASGGVWEPKDKEEFENNIQTLLSSLHCFQFFNESEIYFNSHGIKALIEQLNIIEECNEYSLFNLVDYLRQRIADIGANDWSQSPIQRTDYHYIVQLNAGYTIYPVNIASLAEAAEHSYIGNKTVILNFDSSEFTSDGTIYVNRADINPPHNMCIVNINSISTKEEAIRYYLRNRETVAYNHNPKHGENHLEVRYEGGEVISPLECTQAEAREFIKISVGGNKNSDLFAYDKLRVKYIIFKYENTNPKTYHGFYPYDQKIPQNIKDFLSENLIFFYKFYSEIKSDGSLPV